MEQRLIDDMLAARANALDAARPAMVAARHAQGQGTARERIEALADAGSFVEYGVLAESSAESPGEGPADGLVCGVATLEQQPIVVLSFDPTVHGGSQSRRNSRKFEKVLFLAQTHRWPLVCFVEGEGTRVQEGEPSGDYGSGSRYGIFDGLAELSGWAPTVAIITGRCFAGNAAIALFCDFIVATRGSLLGARGSDAAAPPAELSAEEHEQLGDIDLLVDDEQAAIAAARRYLTYCLVERASGEPSPTARSIAAIVPESRKRAYDMRRVIAAIADADSVLELRPNWARSMLTAFARLEGKAVGFFANQPLSTIGGAIDPDAADKLSRFVELCDAYELPMVSLIDNPGYMVGPEAERAGIARHHARPLLALQNRTVPLYSIQLRKAYGLGPYAMSGYGSSRLVPELRLAWPSVETGGMSLEGAAFLVRRKEIRAAATPEQARAIRDEYAETVRDMRSGLRAGRQFQFDDILEPAETRDRLIAMLRRTERQRPAQKKHYIDPL
jgi:acetyl-CoA carboxylase carboxyltransferase component